VQRKGLASRHLRRLAQWAIAGAVSLFTITAMTATPPLAITSPVEGATVIAGSPVAIAVTVGIW